MIRKWFHALIAGLASQGIMRPAAAQPAQQDEQACTLSDIDAIARETTYEHVGASQRIKQAGQVTYAGLKLGLDEQFVWEGKFSKVSFRGGNVILDVSARETHLTKFIAERMR